MNFEQVKELVKLVDNSTLAFFEIDTQNEHIKMDKSTCRNLNEKAEASEISSVSGTNSKESINSSEDISKNTEIEVPKPKEDDDNLTIITSPMVGTYYSKPSPDSDSFVSKGDNVKKGKIICIIEAMKLMNEIESEYDGTVVECLVNDGDMVEYGQPLFKIKEA